jgi:transposase InsO family protein
MDLHSRNVLSWKLSNSLDTEFCLEALEMALSSGRRRSRPREWCKSLGTSTPA